MSIRSSIANIVSRVVITGLDTAKKCQMVGVKMLAGSLKENVEHLESYGFTSAPQNGAEAVILFPGGDRSHGVVLAVGDRRYRLKGLKQGEVAIYTDEGDSIVLKRGNVIEMSTGELKVTATKKIGLTAPDIELNATNKAAMNTPLVDMSGSAKAAEDMSDGKGTMAAIREVYDDHDHVDSTGGTTKKPGQLMG
ncbi:phage baseplate assembly protein V [Pantoea sp. Bo_2]|uniref:Phage baseplate assembly protein V n=1 Tax=Candidatus Pantoea gossypiicola TaxID=2608008 RepID=A0AB34CEM2_9GAMM|nr:MULTISPECIES: phage baseplate assembly protein V [Pantoea]KAA5937610.1 phage baseplate assembly protein V [Pantoea sp. VH_3]KAA5946741.1 phage baseplate assembly protein V [Pantoea sp. VH_25]KAA5949561.1 phage baseplate assembly protein V [Pantoea sp. VH_24]KAA5957691.1 phage baseplate assembly protein V [Pantoea sp. VH_16]KAA5959175.1 phage baseplate assembly protein V [Pantoea sp. VH_18]